MSQVMKKPDLPYVNKKGADQPAHPQSDQRLCYSLISVVSICKVSSL